MNNVYSNLKLRELRQIADKKGLKISGTKQVIINRLIVDDTSKASRYALLEARRQRDIKNKEDSIKAEKLYRHWSETGEIPDDENNDLDFHMIMYVVSGAEHDGYCSGSENEPFECLMFERTGHISQEKVENFLQALCHEEEGCTSGSGYCTGHAFKKYSAVAVLPFHNPAFTDPDRLKLIKN